MTSSPLFTQFDANRKGSQTAQNILNKSIIALNEIIKFIFNFAGQMVRQFMGK